MIREGIFYARERKCKNCYSRAMTRSSQTPLARSWTDEERRLRLDALMLWWPYADGSLRATIEALIQEAKANIWSQENETLMLRVASATWPLRVAAKRYAATHPDRFWELFLPRCLPTTQLLLLRISEQEGTRALDRLLASPQADLALHTNERIEIELLLPQVYALIWKEDRQEMDELIEEAKHRREEKQLLLDGSTQPSAHSVFEHEMMYGDEM